MALLFSWFILLFATFNVMFGLLWLCQPHDNTNLRVSFKTPLDIALSFRYAAFSWWGWLIYVIFLFRRNSFFNIFHKWKTISDNLVYTSPDIKLRQHMIFLTILMTISTIMENLLLDFNRVRFQCFTSEVMKCYYSKIFPHWDYLLGYNHFLGVGLFFIHKWIWYGLNYADLLIAVVVRALYEKFNTLNKIAKEKLLKVRPVSSSCCVTQIPLRKFIDQNIILLFQYVI